MQLTLLDPSNGPTPARPTRRFGHAAASRSTQSRRRATTSTTVAARPRRRRNSGAASATDTWAEHDDWRLSPEARLAGLAHIAQIRAQLAEIRLAVPAA